MATADNVGEEPTADEVAKTIWDVAYTYNDELTEDEALNSLAERMACSRLGLSEPPDFNQENYTDENIDELQAAEDAWSDAYFGILSSLIQAVLTEVMQLNLPYIGGYKKYQPE